MKASVNSIESCGTVDGPGIRTVIFLNKCLLRCKYCHNPETWNMQGYNYTSDELVKKIIRFKPYYKNGGGVTFSGGEPLLQNEFLLDILKKLKRENIHIALDTAGYSNTVYDEILDYVDLVIYDIKDIDKEKYRNLTGGNIEKTWEFLRMCRAKNKEFWIRQVIVPGLHDNERFINDLDKYIKKHFDISKVLRIEFLPYHKLGTEKYRELGLFNPYENLNPMDEKLCDELYKKFMNIYNGE